METKDIEKSSIKTISSDKHGMIQNIVKIIECNNILLAETPAQFRNLFPLKDCLQVKENKIQEANLVKIAHQLIYHLVYV